MRLGHCRPGFMTVSCDDVIEIGKTWLLLKFSDK